MQKILLFLSFSVLYSTAWCQETLHLQGDTLIELQGRQIRLNQQGFPQQITFSAGPAKNAPVDRKDLLAENIHFHFTRASDGKDIRLKSRGLHITRNGGGRIQWDAVNISDELQVEVEGAMTAKGTMKYKVKLTALRELELKEIAMHIPFQPDMAGELKWAGSKPGPRPDSMVRWTWREAGGAENHALEKMEGVWIGTDRGGLQYVLQDGKVWGNEGEGGISKGGILIGIKGKSMLANNYSGPRHMQKGAILYYNFSLRPEAEQ